MSRSTVFAKSVAFGVALAVHYVALGAIFSEAPVDIEGTSGATTARLGSSFADIATSVAHPVTPDTADVQQPQDRPVTQPTTQSMSQTVTAPVQQHSAKAVTAMTPLVHQAQRPVTTATATPRVSTPMQQTPSAVPTVAVTQSVIATPVQAVQTPAQAIAQSQPTQTVAEVAEPVDQTQAQVPEQVTLTKVEPQKPVEVIKPKPAPKPEPKPKPAPKPKPKPKKAPSVASAAAVAGQSDGSKTSKTKFAGNSGTSKEAGNAAASNYPGQVMRRIQRIPRPKVRTKGRAQVSFRISANGGLDTARISKSSGSAKLDQAALRIIKKAAPFPKPPQGAQRSFAVFIESR